MTKMNNIKVTIKGYPSYVIRDDEGPWKPMPQLYVEYSSTERRVVLTQQWYNYETRETQWREVEVKN